MTNEELKDKYMPLITNPWIIHDVMNVNHRPHPFTIGPKHVAHAADNHGGMLGEATLKAIPCAWPKCSEPFEDHVSDRVIALKLTRNCTNDEASSVLQPLGKQMEEDGIDGIVLIETPEKFRVSNDGQENTSAEE